MQAITIIHRNKDEMKQKIASLIQNGWSDNQLSNGLDVVERGYSHISWLDDFKCKYPDAEIELIPSEEKATRFGYYMTKHSKL